MTPELKRWSDERLDDLARRVEDIARQQEAISSLREDLATLRAEVGGVGGDTTQCIAEVRELKADLRTREKVQHDERRADRKWMIGTLLMTAGIIVSALAIFLG